MAAASGGNAVGVRDMVNEPRSVARHVDDQTNHYRLAFGPTNVGLHHVATLVGLREGLAVEIAASLDQEGIGMLRRERRATYLIDIARGYSQWKADESLGKPLEAERLAPREVNCRPVAGNLISNLIERSRGKVPTALQSLSERSGVAA